MLLFTCDAGLLYLYCMFWLCYVCLVFIVFDCLMFSYCAVVVGFIIY